MGEKEGESAEIRIVERGFQILTGNGDRLFELIWHSDDRERAKKESEAKREEKGEGP